jgi:hypothetical protein
VNKGIEIRHEENGHRFAFDFEEEATFEWGLVLE